MACVAVTRGGLGDFWHFATPVAAMDHPIIQFGDALCCCPQDVRLSFSLAEMSDIARRLGDPQLERATMSYSQTGGASDGDRRHFSEKLWDLMSDRAEDPPTSPDRIVATIVADRVATRNLSTPFRPPHGKSYMTEAVQESTPVADAAAAPAKVRPIPRESKYAKTSIITLGTDKDGKKYGSENNPKKAGSKFARALRSLS